jgi:methylphosphotriester-DNA--protein-cysteine methyltransferase
VEDLSKYQLLKSNGRDPLSVYLVAKEDGHDPFARIRILRAIFGLTLKEAKSISFQADTGKTLESQERALVDGFVRVLDEELGPDRKQSKAKSKAEE